MSAKQINPEFDKFTSFMDKLARVPHREPKEKREAEKREKFGEEKQVMGRILLLGKANQFH